jgi:hypothetical protein
MVKKWTRICQQKPLLIKIILEKYNKPVVWLDADSIIEREPVIFKNIEKDFAVHYIGGHELGSAVLYFKNNSHSYNIIKDWVKENNKDSNSWDQRTLQKIIKEKYLDNEFRLPKEYCSIFDRPDYQKINKVITQWQASRKLKHKGRKE